MNKRFSLDIATLTIYVKHPTERWWHEYIYIQEYTVWMEQPEEDDRCPVRQESTITREGKHAQDDRSATYAVQDGAAPVTSSHVKKLEVTDMKMCRWACGHTLTDHVRNENIKERR